ncbi:hypothetical protein LWC33_31285 [Pseudonocardia sp. RS11V-5]|nr:hypothetical protein [Pseudonocardia terrae]MCE3555915.1 hypothetical protein [Pseudonocardia terrae]
MPIMAGFCTDEALLHTFPDPERDRAGVERALAGVVADPPAYLDDVRGALPDLGWGTILRKTHEQHGFVSGILAWLDAARDEGLPVWGYEFAWRTAAFGGDPGAYHDLEVPFVFALLDRDATLDMTGPEPPRALEERMHGDWIRFVRDHTLPTPRFDGTFASLAHYDVRPRPYPWVTETLHHLHRAHRVVPEGARP